MNQIKLETFTINKEREKFEKIVEKLVGSNPALKCLFLLSSKTGEYEFEPISFGWIIYQAAKADLNAEHLQRARLFNEQVDKIADLECKLKNAVPEGYVLIPKEPTHKMYRLFQDGFNNAQTGNTAQNFKIGYKAMIEAQEQGDGN